MANYSLEGSLRRGTVVSVGDQVREVKEGDRVCWTVEFGNPVKHGEEEYHLLYETEIIGKLDNE
jgi:co-chaperonin GroES (HSP10)